MILRRQAQQEKQKPTLVGIGDLHRILKIAPPTPFFTSLLAAVQPACEIMLNRISGIEQCGDKVALLALKLPDTLSGTPW